MGPITFPGDELGLPGGHEEERLKEEKQGGADFRASKWLLCQSVKYRGEMKLDRVMCGRVTSVTLMPITE